MSSFFSSNGAWKLLITQVIGKTQRESRCALTCVFQETLQGGLNTSQKISTHVLKLTSDNKKIKNVLFHGWKMMVMIQEKDVLVYLFIFPVTSMSFMKHSILSGKSDELALMSFFSFSHSWYSRTKALGFDFTSSLYLLANSSQKCFTRASSKSLPPSSGSEAVDSIWEMWRQSQQRVKQQNKSLTYDQHAVCCLVAPWVYPY